MPPSTPRPKAVPGLTAEAASAAGAALPPPPQPVSRRRKPPTRRTAHTVESIVSAAIELLDESGVVGLSMRGVAERLGTGPASLYAHVAGKEELLELVFDELVGQVPLPQPDAGRWREQVHQMLADLREILAGHRDAALAGLGRIPTSPQTLTAAETLVAVLRAGGLSDRTVALGLDQLILYVSASAFEAGLYQHGMSVDELRRYHEEIHAYYNALPSDRFPVLASIAPEITGPDGDERFEFGLRILIAGLEAADVPRQEGR